MRKIQNNSIANIYQYKTDIISFNSAYVHPLKQDVYIFKKFDFKKY